MSSFSQFQLHDTLTRALELMKFSTPTKVQVEAINPAMEGSDLMVSAATGSGKTAAFLLPVIHRMLTVNAPNTSTRVLILLPTRELALQTQKTFEQLAKFTPVKCGLVIGGEAFKHQVATLRKNPEVVIATPGRLVEHIEKGTPDFSDLEILVLDEADRMLDMGFAEDMNTISKSCREQRQTLLYSATLKHKSMRKIRGILNDPVSLVVDDHRQSHQDISQQKIICDNNEHKIKLVQALLAEHQSQRCMVFCKTREQCEQVNQALLQENVRSAYIHGEITQSARKQVMNRFKSGAVHVLVATDLAARGLDIDNVDLVINYTVAQSGDEHVHRIGRTGRAGNKGLAITLVDNRDWNLCASIERYLKTPFELIALKGLKAKYNGPKKVKSSGKAAGKKKPKKKTVTANAPKKKTKAAKPKSAQRKKTSGGSQFTPSDEGFSPLRKKK